MFAYVKNQSMDEEQRIWNQLKRNIAMLLTSSLGLTAALTYQDAIKSLFEKGQIFEKIGRQGVWYIAGFTTLLAFFATYTFTRFWPEENLTPIKPNPIKIH